MLVSVFLLELFLIFLALLMLLVLSFFFFCIKIDNIKMRPQQLQRSRAILVRNNPDFPLRHPFSCEMRHV